MDADDPQDGIAHAPPTPEAARHNIACRAHTSRTACKTHTPSHHLHQKLPIKLTLIRCSTASLPLSKIPPTWAPGPEPPPALLNRMSTCPMNAARSTRRLLLIATNAHAHVNEQLVQTPNHAASNYMPSVQRSTHLANRLTLVPPPQRRQSLRRQAPTPAL